jgi:hypothetical protein
MGSVSFPTGIVAAILFVSSRDRLTRSITGGSLVLLLLFELQDHHQHQHAACGQGETTEQSRQKSGAAQRGIEHARLSFDAQMRQTTASNLLATVSTTYYSSLKTVPDRGPPRRTSRSGSRSAAGRPAGRRCWWAPARTGTAPGPCSTSPPYAQMLLDGRLSFDAQMRQTTASNLLATVSTTYWP